MRSGAKQLISLAQAEIADLVGRQIEPLKWHFTSEKDV